jgi:hypothetical protein
MAQTLLGSRNPNFPQVQTARKLVGSRAPHLETSKLETSKTKGGARASLFGWMTPPKHSDTFATKTGTEKV